MPNIKYIVRPDSPKTYEILRLSPHIYLGDSDKPWEESKQVYSQSVHRGGLKKVAAEVICKQLNKDEDNT